jgi:hypothetical protein
VEAPSEAEHVAEWARAHRASFEIAPLLETVHHVRVNVGSMIHVYASLPVNGRLAAGRWVEAAETRAHLRHILRALVPSAGHLEIQPPRTALTLSPGSDVEVEVAITARVVNGAKVTSTLAAVRRLKRLGFEERRRSRPVAPGPKEAWGL